MDFPNDPSRVLEQARQHLEALKQAGLSRETLLSLLEETSTSTSTTTTTTTTTTNTNTNTNTTQTQPSPPLPQIKQQPFEQQSPPPPPHQQYSQQPQFSVSQDDHPANHDGASNTDCGPSHSIRNPSLSPPGPPPPSFGYQPSHQIRLSVSSTNSSKSGHSLAPSCSGTSISNQSTSNQSSSNLSIISQTTARSSVSSVSGSTVAGGDARYWCTSCDKTFKRKFDWKRHEEEFHERWRKYPCPNCNQSFWGPNTFNQHHKSAHGCKSCPHSDGVVKYMRKRKAWGCGFCAAMHGKLEKHYEHVAAHFECGSLKSDWLHSNVIYGLLHQPAVLLAWKDLVAEKEAADKFQGHQPMFSWSPDETGRAQGYVEGESPGKLQDLLEFFDGSREMAVKIARLAWSYCHVILKPKDSSQVMPQHQSHLQPAQQPSTAQTNAHKHFSMLGPSPHRSPRRVTSSASLSVGRQASRRITSNDYLKPQVSMQMTSPPQHTTLNNPFTAFIPTQQFQPALPLASQSSPCLHTQPQQQSMATPSLHSHTPRMVSLDKELPPAPMLPTAMDIDLEVDVDLNYNMYDRRTQPMPKLSETMEEWSGLPSTLLQGHAMAGQTDGFQPTWADLGQQCQFVVPQQHQGHQ